MLRIGVFPPAELETERALFSALETVFAARFVAGAQVDGEPCDGYILIGASPVLDRPDTGPFRALRFMRPTHHDHTVGTVAFHDSDALDPRLRGRSLTDRHTYRGGPLSAGGSVLASDADSNPLWVKRLSEESEVDDVAVAPPHLLEGEALRDHLVPGRFLALLPIVHFIRELSRQQQNNWQPQPLRATFVIDDPNLHWGSYGSLDYRHLAAHARTHGYHVGMATVPLDAWFVYPPAARLFRSHAQHLSLCVHGNDHSGPELGRSVSEKDGVAMLAQALRRTDRLESRSGVSISRVMVPPHESCSEQMLRLLMRLGFDAVSMTRPHPWISLAEQLSPYASSPGDVSAGWFPAEIREDGFPILLRRDFLELEEAPLRAFLDQPLIFYGHLSDLASGLAPLEAFARSINSLPDVHWCSLGEIAATNFQTRRLGSAGLEVRPFARRISLSGLDGIEEITIDWQQIRGAPTRVECVGPDSAGKPLYTAGRTQRVRLVSEASHLEVTLLPTDSVHHTVIAPPRRRLMPIARRLTTEARDRVTPYADWLRSPLHMVRSVVSRDTPPSATTGAASQLRPTKDAA